MQLRTAVLTIGLLALILFAGVAVSPATAQSGNSIEGVVLPIAADEEQKFLDQGEQFDEVTPFDIPRNPVLVFDGSQKYIVFADREVSAGYIEADGQFLTTEEDVFVAESIDHTTEGEPADADDVFENPDDYKGQLVRIELDQYEQGAIAVGTSDTPWTGQFVGGDATTKELELSQPPGSVSVSLLDDIVDEGDTAGDLSPDSAFVTPLNSVPVRPNMLGFGERRFWGQGSATVDVGIVQGDFAVITDVEYDAQSVDIQALNSGDYDGEMVTVDANAAETRVSTKETLNNALSCGPNLIYIGSGCLPAVADVVVHGGVLYDSRVSEDAVVYIGFSNTIQGTPATTAAREATVTGEVVSLSQLGAEFDQGRAIIASDIEYGGRVSSVPAFAEDRRDELAAALQRQIEQAGDPDKTVASPETAENASNTAADEDPIEIIDPRITDTEPKSGPAELRFTMHNTADREVNATVNLTRDDSLSQPDITTTFGPGEEIKAELLVERVDGTNVTVHVEGQKAGEVFFPEYQSSKRPPDEENQGSPELTVVDGVPEEIEQVPSSENIVRLQVTVKNTGDADYRGDFVLENADTGRTAENSDSVSLQPGQTGSIEVTYIFKQQSVDFRIRSEDGSWAGDAGTARIVEVEEKDKFDSDSPVPDGIGPGFGPAVAVLALLGSLVGRRYS